MASPENLSSEGELAIMTFDEAYVAAAELLVKREQLLNGHLLRLVDGDKALYSELRVALIRDGLAKDRPGAGLVHARMTVTAGAVEKGFRELSERPDPVVRRSDEASPADESSDWWLMVSGVIQGPFTYETLARMHRQGEIAPGDVVRQGTKGCVGGPTVADGGGQSAGRPGGLGWFNRVCSYTVSSPSEDMVERKSNASVQVTSGLGSVSPPLWRFQTAELGAGDSDIDGTVFRLVAAAASLRDDLSGIYRLLRDVTKIA